MIKFEHTEVVGWEHAIRGMRNAKNSWDKSDSHFDGCGDDCSCQGCSSIDTCECIGPVDHKLMTQLRNAGTDHRKYLRMIVVYVDITAPLYWWKEFDTYKVGTVANSCSTMHTIHEKEFTLDDFSHEHLMNDGAMAGFNLNGFFEVRGYLNTPLDDLEYDIEKLNMYRAMYLKTKDKRWWWQMIQLLPSTYNQKRTVMMNYEVLANIYKSRNAHKLDEWRVGFCDWIKQLPYSELITGEV